MYNRTHSAFLAAVTFVTSVVPIFIGGVTLAWLADRLPRRAVMITCDLVRCALVLLMAVPGVPLVALVVLLFAVTLIGAPFTSARAAIFPEVLDGDKYVVGTSVTLTTNQLAQVIGFAAGGAMVGFLGIRTSLVVDAGTYAASAVIVRAWVRFRPAPAQAAPGQGARGGFLEGVRIVFASPALRIPMFFGWLAAFYNAPEGVAAPLAKSLGGGATAVGVILASQVFGETLGAIGFSRLVRPATRLRLIGPLGIAACGMLVLFAIKPGLIAALLILAVSGACGCYQVAANAAFVRAVPPERRSQAFGLAQGGMSLGQGTLMILAGAAVQQQISPATVIGACGALGTAVAVAVAISAGSVMGHRARHELPR